MGSNCRLPGGVDKGASHPEAEAIQGYLLDGRWCCRGLPISLTLTPGGEHDSMTFGELGGGVGQ